jgi:hypothetical protein
LNYCVYDPLRHRDAVERIWREIGWWQDVEGGGKSRDTLLSGVDAIVYEIDGEAECLVATAPGTIRYLQESLPLNVVTSIATSLVARRQGLARGLAATAVARGAAAGSLVSILAIFDQGYYNGLGFGNGGYEHSVSFYPAQLLVHETPRRPQRITVDDWAAVHAGRLARLHPHGSIDILPAEFTYASMLRARHGFGLGYPGPGGHGFSHYLWCRITGDQRHGPYGIRWMVYETPAQFRELMALVKSWGDQVHLVTMPEPPGIQMQDLLARPFATNHLTEGSKFATGVVARANWQARILDLPGCMERTHLECAPCRFNLSLSDPIERFLESGWRGVAGDYVVTLGQESEARRGNDVSLPTLEASVGAFTRLWLGVRPATGLACTDALSGPPQLLSALDAAFRLPEPKPDWHDL